MIFTIDKGDPTRMAIRKIVIDFFKNYLGFKDDEIIFIDRTEFGRDQDKYPITMFSAQT